MSKPITVQELIAKLQHMNAPDALVMMEEHSEFYSVKAGDLQLQVNSEIDCGFGENYIGNFVVIRTRA